jgi:hypothetical protein
MWRANRVGQGSSLRRLSSICAARECILKWRKVIDESRTDRHSQHANARLDRAAGVIEQHQATRRRLPALVCQQSHKAAADEVAKMNLPGVCMRAWEVAAAAENGFIQQLRG